MRTLLLTFLLANVSILLMGQEKLHTIKKNGMEVQWHREKDKIRFKMTAPTTGWVTIGFNEFNVIIGAYLLMGRVRQNETEVVEHFTIGPGNYVPIKTLDDKILVSEVSGVEAKSVTTILFSVAVSSTCTYQKDLAAGTPYWMTLAYSLEDDYQHHSMMRTSVRIKL
ncbi:DOMON domain-containing protein [uncultured Kriegella sp.]|uniref:DOMON domain-containing protein n=1 Tax=uncultured Kriegella sp. TaxID=1798910 RepID=UPI0030DAA048|tara:strand:+ start:289060 stop:289560 length:501 start_codon:yes stop_codon:yes gene_type:complete